MGLLSNRVVRSDLKPGDHVYSWRTAYTYAHHGIYVGDGKVIHFTRGPGQELGTGTFLDNLMVSRLPNSSQSCSECQAARERGGVVLSCLDCFLAGQPLYRYEYGVDTVTFLAKARGGTCTTAVADRPEEVLHRAHYLLQNGFGDYHIFRNNCEDFTIYCKTGLLVVDANAIGRSGQAVSTTIGASLAAAFTSPLGLAITAGVYCLSRYAADVGVRTDVAKVEVEDLAMNLGWSARQ